MFFHSGRIFLLVVAEKFCKELAKLGQAFGDIGESIE